jgi:hypothetical protein
LARGQSKSGYSKKRKQYHAPDYTQGVWKEKGGWGKLFAWENLT